MKVLFFWLLSGLFLVFSCSKSQEDEKKYHLMSYYGTIAGITTSFQKGECVWNFKENELEIVINKTDPFLHNLSTGYKITGSNPNLMYEIDSLGLFSGRYSGDTLFLVAPCCDMIDYTLVAD